MGVAIDSNGRARVLTGWSATFIHMEDHLQVIIFLLSQSCMGFTSADIRGLLDLDSAMLDWGARIHLTILQKSRSYSCYSFINIIHTDSAQACYVSDSGRVRQTRNNSALWCCVEIDTYRAGKPCTIASGAVAVNAMDHKSDERTFIARVAVYMRCLF